MRLSPRIIDIASIIFDLLITALSWNPCISRVPFFSFTFLISWLFVSLGWPLLPLPCSFLFSFSLSLSLLSPPYISCCGAWRERAIAALLWELVFKWETWVTIEDISFSFNECKRISLETSGAINLKQMSGRMILVVSYKCSARSSGRKRARNVKTRGVEDRRLI